MDKLLFFFIGKIFKPISDRRCVPPLVNFCFFGNICYDIAQITFTHKTNFTFVGIDPSTFDVISKIFFVIFKVMHAWLSE